MRVVSGGELRHVRNWGRRGGFVIAGPAVALLLAVFAIPALAATPKVGCWGYCGGPIIPKTAYFEVANRHVDSFGIYAGCLGSSKAISIVKHLPISHTGTFSFDGTAERGFSPHVHTVHVKLSGRFTAATVAKVTLHIAYGGCRTIHSTVHRLGG